MKKNKKRLFLSMGAITLVASPIAIVACGDSKPPENPVVSILNQTNKNEFTTYDSKNGALIIKSNVNIISPFAFFGGNWATGDNSTEIHSITFEDNSQCYFIGFSAFSGVVTVPELIIPDSVIVIDEDAFDTLETSKLVLNDSLISIGDSAFLVIGSGGPPTELTIPNSVRNIGDNAFEGAHINRLILSKNIEYIGDSAFANADLTSLILPDGILGIGNGTFSDMPSLTSLTLPKSIESIEDNAFANSPLTSLIFEGSSAGSILQLGEGSFILTKISAIAGGTGTGSWQEWAENNYPLAFEKP